MCPNNTSPQDGSSICHGAIAITSYVCKAIKSGDLPPSDLIPKIKDLDKISQVNGLCDALGETQFQDSLCKIVETRLRTQPFLIRYQKPLDEICRNLPHKGFPKLCVDSCSGNQRACKIILQGLRTIIHLEELKESDDGTAIADGDSDVKPDLNLKPAEKIEPKTNVSQNGPLIDALSRPLQQQSRPVTVQDQTTQEKPSTIRNLANSLNTPSSNIPIINTTLTPDAAVPIQQSTRLQSTVSPSSFTTLKSEVGSTKISSPVPSTSTKAIAGSSDTSSKTTTNELQDGDDETADPSQADDQEGLLPEDEIPKSDTEPNQYDEDNAEKDMEKPVDVKNTVPEKPSKPDQSYDSQSEIDEDPTNTHFLFYFLAFVVISVVCYVVYQRRNRIIALVVEGRSGPNGRRRGSSTRERPSSGSYRKLVNNLEEAISSQSVKKSNVIY